MVGWIVCNRTFRISTVSRIPHFAYVSDVESEDVGVVGKRISRIMM
jgi:hypothetical protein